MLLEKSNDQFHCRDIGRGVLILYQFLYEALVRVLLSPVNASDLHMVRGRYGYQPELPASPGIEGVGIVEAVGPVCKVRLLGLA
jgi:threonine dehydrogenase-like Zn-dependent dehydrogenase